MCLISKNGLFILSFERSCRELEAKVLINIIIYSKTFCKLKKFNIYTQPLFNYIHKYTIEKYFKISYLVVYFILFNFIKIYCKISKKKFLNVKDLQFSMTIFICCLFFFYPNGGFYRDLFQAMNIIFKMERYVLFFAKF